MRDTFYKYLPWALGGLIGWWMWSPPVWLQSLGPMAYVVNLILLAVLLLVTVGLIIVANLPAKLEMEAIDEGQVDPELRALAGRIESLGFRRAGPPRRVKIAPSAILLGYAHPTEPIYATAFRTETVPAELSCDFVSVLHGDRGGLTTNSDPGGAALPAGDGGLRQVFPGATPDILFRRHREGLAYLLERGVHCRAVSTDLFPQDLQLGIGRQREVFAAAPFRGTLVTLWRAGTKRVPFLGPLREQPIARTQIARLLTS